MHSIEFFRRKKFFGLGQWALCGGFCVLLGACSTLGMTKHVTGKGIRSAAAASQYPSPEKPNVDGVDIETLPDAPIMFASYRSSPYDTISNLPYALDYSVDKNRQWVDELGPAP